MAYPWDNARDNRLRDLWAKGKTFAEIAADIDPDNLTVEIVRHRRRTLDLPTHPREERNSERWSPEVDAAFAKAWRSGIRIAKIAADLDIPIGALRRRAEKLGLGPQFPQTGKPSGDDRKVQAGSFWTDERKAILRETWGRPDITISEIAKRLDAATPPHKETVRHAANRLSLGKRPAVGRRGWCWTAERDELIRSMNRAGRGDPSIAKALGDLCTTRMVFDRRKKLGIPAIPTPPPREKRSKPKATKPLVATTTVIKAARPKTPSPPTGFRFGPQQSTPSSSPKPPMLEALERFDREPESGVGVSIMEIGAHSGCRWPLGQIAAGGHHAFCGEAGYPYCEAHAARVYVSPAARKEVDRRLRKAGAR